LISDKFNTVTSTNQTNKLKQSQQFGDHLRRQVTLTRWRAMETLLKNNRNRTMLSTRGRTRHTSWRIFAGFSCSGHVVVLIGIKNVIQPVCWLSLQWWHNGSLFSFFDLFNSPL